MKRILRPAFESSHATHHCKQSFNRFFEKSYHRLKDVLQPAMVFCKRRCTTNNYVKESQNNAGNVKKISPFASFQFNIYQTRVYLTPPTARKVKVCSKFFIFPKEMTRSRSYFYTTNLIRIKFEFYLFRCFCLSLPWKGQLP